jgi:hypothetical protein
MPDISMCSNRTCPQRNECYRFRAVPNPYRQAYSDFKPDVSGVCDHFSSIKGYSDKYLTPILKGEPT